MSEPLRSDELQAEAIDRLTQSSEIRRLLSDDPDGWSESDWSDGTWSGDLNGGGVIPVAIAQQSDGLDPRVSVGASLNSVTRANRLDDASGTVRVIVDGTKDYVAANGILGLSRIQAAVVDAMTDHAPGFHAAGLDSEEEIAWNDNINRYVGVAQFSVERPAASRSP